MMCDMCKPLDEINGSSHSNDSGESGNHHNSSTGSGSSGKHWSGSGDGQHQGPGSAQLSLMLYPGGGTSSKDNKVYEELCEPLHSWFSDLLLAVSLELVLLPVTSLPARRVVLTRMCAHHSTCNPCACLTSPSLGSLLLLLIRSMH